MNPCVDHTTPGTLLLEEHWRNLGLDRGWSEHQVRNLAAKLRMTPHELGLMACIPVKETTRLFKLQKRFSPSQSLHFHLLAAWHRAQQTCSVMRPGFPADITTACVAWDRGKDNPTTP